MNDFFACNFGKNCYCSRRWLKMYFCHVWEFFCKLITSWFSCQSYFKVYMSHVIYIIFSVFLAPIHSSTLKIMLFTPQQFSTSLQAIFRSNLDLRKVIKKNQHCKQFHFTEHRSVKNTNIAHHRVWDHRNTASWDFIHRITALKKHWHHNTANPHVPLSK